MFKKYNIVGNTSTLPEGNSVPLPLFMSGPFKISVLLISWGLIDPWFPFPAFKLVEIMTGNKPIANVNTKLQAAQTLLDRVGVVKQEKLDINHNVQGGIFILPEKEIIDVEAEEVNVEEKGP